MAGNHKIFAIIHGLTYVWVYLDMFMMPAMPRMLESDDVAGDLRRVCCMWFASKECSEEKMDLRIILRLFCGDFF